MKKSIMLSATIMLVILFLTLTTTTFAWYQAQGGEIHVSGSSTASVTTTGPDSPYLVISDTASDLTNITGSEAPNSSYYSTTFNGNELQLASLKDNPGAFGTNNWEINYDGSPYNPLVFTFYIKNTSESFDLWTEVLFEYSDSSSNTLMNNDHYCYALVFTSAGNKVKNRNSSQNVTCLNSSYYDNSGTLHNAVVTTYDETPANDSRIRILGGEVITCTLYVWLNGYSSGTKLMSSNDVSNTVINSFTITFGHIEIATSN